MRGAPVVAVRACLLGGGRMEETPGQALVAGRMLAEGTAGRGWRQIAEEAEGRGMAIAATAAPEVTQVAVDALAGDWRLAVDRAAEILLEPSFPEDRVRRVVEQTAAEWAALQDEPEVRTGWRFLDQLYRPHPRSRPLQGDPESLAALTADDCRRFHLASLERGAIVAVAGRVDPDAVRDRLGQALAGLEGERAPAREPPLPRGAPERRREVALPAAETAHLYAGHLTAARRDPDLPALTVLGVVLGSGAGLRGRIPMRVREVEALAYSAQADTAAAAGLDPGRLEIYVATTPERVGRVTAAVAEEMERLLGEGVSESEVEEARRYLLGRLPFQRETAGQWAELLAAAELYALPVDRIEWVAGRLEAVDRREVEDAARRWLRPEDLRITVGRPG